jgi:hypothetical protein
MLSRPSKACSSDGLNSAQLQRGHLRRIHSTRGSQLGQLVDSAFMQDFLPMESWHLSQRRSIFCAGICVEPCEQATNAAGS